MIPINTVKQSAIKDEEEITNIWLVVRNGPFWGNQKKKNSLKKCFNQKKIFRIHIATF